MRLSNSTVSRTVLIGSALVGFSVSANTLAAEGATATGDVQLEEVVVTAERREADIQKSANSVTVRTGADLQAQGRYSLTQILEDVPGVQLQGGGGAAGGRSVNTSSEANNLVIRGIPSNGGGGGGAPNTVAAAAAVYVDGVYGGIGGGYDIDRVEVLRGPQGTLYGRSATSGLVSTFTANPSMDKVGGNASLEVGNYALQHYSAALNLPLGDALAVRVSGNRYQRDGYYGAAGGALSNTDGRVKLLYKPSDDFSVLLGAAMANGNPANGAPSISQVKPTPDVYQYTPNTVGRGHNRQRQYWSEVNWNLGFATLTWEPSYRTFASDNKSDSLNYTNRVGQLDFHESQSVSKDNTHTEELRLASNGDSKLSWLAGVYYYVQTFASKGRNDAEGAFPPFGKFVAFDANLKDKNTKDYAAYVQATYNLSDSWRVTGGLRYDDTKIKVVEDYCATPLGGSGVTCGSIPNSKDNAHRGYKNTTWKARVEHDLTAQNMLYASISTGFSPGDVSLSQDNTNLPYVLDLKAETLTSYEVGSKNRFLDNRLQLNGSAFYYDYGAYQSGGVDLSLAAGTTPVAATISSPAQVIGAEFESIYQLTANDRVGFNLAYTDARFVGKHGVQILVNGVPQFFGGQPVTFATYFYRDEIPGVVPVSASLSLDHNLVLPGGAKLSLHGDARYIGARYLASLKEIQVPWGAEAFIHVGDKVVANFSATLATSNNNYSLTTYVRNVGQNRYKSSAGAQGNTSAAVSYNAGLYDPRTYGVVLNARF